MISPVFEASGGIVQMPRSVSASAHFIPRVSSLRVAVWVVTPSHSCRSGGEPTYVMAPTVRGTGLAPYGVDHSAKTAGAVIDHTNTQLTVTNFEATRNCR